ncbi:MAG: CooT family nickel-binding protein, partial [Clostridiales bacterium]|nr:CooT family nickel-binding protein [Clostridiales bacterium]
GDTITLTDMMGAKKIISGTIKDIDLLKNVILIETC